MHKESGHGICTCDSIYVDGIEFKIKFPKVRKLLEDLHISTKYVINAKIQV
jgi:hypothetical protein